MFAALQRDVGDAGISRHDAETAKSARLIHYRPAPACLPEHDWPLLHELRPILKFLLDSEFSLFGCIETIATANSPYPSAEHRLA
jgi:hypothetical protein